MEPNKKNKLQFAPIQFVSGKGGVGKSSLAAAIAFKLARENKKVLLVELGEQSFYEKFFQLQNVDYKPSPLDKNLDVARWDHKACLREYVGFYIKSEKLYDVFFDNQIMKRLIEAAPALKELAILGKATSGPRNVGPKIPYDHIVIDSYSMGHHKALLNGPRAVTQVIRRGPMGHHSEKINDILTDPNWTSHFVVLKPEELPTQEGLELFEDLQSSLNVESQLIMNMVLEEPISKEQFEELSNPMNSNYKLVKFYKRIFEEQRECLKKIDDRGLSFTQIPFNYEVKDKFKFISSMSEFLE